MQKYSKNHSIPPISDDHLRLWLQNAPTICMEDDHLSDLIPISSSLPSSEKSINSGELSSLEDVILPRSTSKQINNNVQERKSSHVGDEGLESGGEKCKRQKKPRCNEVHNMNERLRRKKLAEKMAALREMIPNSVKRDQASTIDDAIKYIQTLQCLVLQMMSGDVGLSCLMNAPVVMVGQQLQGIQIPSLAPVLQTRSILSSVVGLPNPWSAGSSAAAAATSPGLLNTNSLQNNINPEPLMYANSIPYCHQPQRGMK